jgi:translation initiation factor IF-1
MNEGVEKKTATGVVEEVLPDSLFRVRVNPTEEAGDVARDTSQNALVLAYLAGKMRMNRIRVLMGDKVEMVLDPYGGRARIVRRLS